MAQSKIRSAVVAYFLGEASSRALGASRTGRLLNAPPFLR
jgi:hypothetical protein